jgi:SAM-dependent methyltransferase
MSTNFGPGLHVAAGRAVDTSAYDRYIGRWSRLFVPAVLQAAEVRPGCRVLDLCTGTGEAALMMLPIVGASGLVVGADISPAMLVGARDRLDELSFWPVAADGQALPFSDDSFDVVMPAWLAVLSGPGSRIEGVPPRPSYWGRRGRVCHLDPRPGTNVGHSCQCAQPLPPGAAGYNLSLFRTG